MNVEEAILSRRSVRRYADRPVDPALLARVVNAGLWAPTGSNTQPWAFIAITRPMTLHQIRVVSPGMLWEPRALVCICSDRERAGTSRLGPELARLDCAMAAENMMLMAVELGLGSCVVHSTNLGAVRQILGLPAHLEPELLINFGYPDGPLPSPPARDPGAIYWEKYGERSSPAPG